MTGKSLNLLSVINDQVRSCLFGDWSIEGCVENLGPDAAKYMMAKSSERTSMISSCFACGTMGGSFAASQSEYLVQNSMLSVWCFCPGFSEFVCSFQKIIFEVAREELRSVGSLVMDRNTSGVST